MKIYLRLTLLVVLAALTLQASRIGFSSQGTALDPTEWNSMGATVVIYPAVGWAPALSGSSWVSYGNTGNEYLTGYFMPPNDTVVSFYETLMLPFVPTSAFVTYRADDTAALYVNGVLVRPEAPANGNTYRLCSDYAVGCTISTQVTMDITSFLHPDGNTLRFDVAQRGSYSFGLNYSGFAEGTDSPLPEPATYALIGAALLGMGIYRRKR